MSGTQAKRRKRSLKARLRKRARAALRQAVTGTKSRVVKLAARLVEERVVRQASRDYWEREYPNPRRPQQLILRKELTEDEEELETYQAYFYSRHDPDSLTAFMFTVEWDEDIAIDDAAYAAAVEVHGSDALGWRIDHIRPVNGPAKLVLPGGWRP
jgi:hypothetical protein